MRARSMPGKGASARNSVPKATQSSVSAITAGLQAMGSRNGEAVAGCPTTKA
jgi:hypothetical protein